MIRVALALADGVTHPRRRARALVIIARGAIALFGWPATLRAWERHYPQPGPAVRIHLDAVDAIDATVREIAREPRERALACLALVRSSGMEADLIIDAGHVWVECGPRILGDQR